MTDETTPILEEIESLLAAPPEGREGPSLARIEHTLTAGYARALALEAERWRLERRIGEVASSLADSDTEHRTAELAALARRKSTADVDLSRLRGRLASLRTRASTLRGLAALL
ncbi:MAG: hypothetical protein ACRDN6_15740 [Gaiellaceae bacterium]